MTVRTDRGGDNLDDATIYQQENVTKATTKRDSMVQTGFSFSNRGDTKTTNTTKNDEHNNHPELSVSKTIIFTLNAA